MSDGQRTSFVLVIHNHQPGDNPAEIFEEAFRSAYLPFIETLTAFPGMKVVLHYSGPVLEYLERTHPWFIAEIGRLAASGQVELLTGAFYEPILPVIPEEDRVGQILRLTGALERLFGTTPRGMWLPERVWEPQIARQLVEAGVRYTVVDDHALGAAGIPPGRRHGPWATEEMARALVLFAIDERLRRMMPFSPAPDLLCAVRSMAEAGVRLVVVGDDGEKLGMWPGTQAACRPGGWLENLFRLLRQSEDWLEVCTFGEYLRTGPCKPRVYVPPASYREMEGWAGGMWRKFLVKYPEADHLHKRMLLAAREVGNAGRPGEAVEELWRAQANCVYWHGVFGGIHLAHLRNAAYGHLIRAEMAAERAAGAAPGPCRVEQVDFDADGADEVVVRGADGVIFVDPGEGGGIFEWDYRPVGVNVVNSFGGERDGREELRWGCFLERVAPVGEGDRCRAGRRRQVAAGWPEVRQAGGQVVIRVSYRRMVGEDLPDRAVDIEKELTISRRAEAVVADYRAASDSPEVFRLLFGVELAFSVLDARGRWECDGGPGKTAHTVDSCWVGEEMASLAVENGRQGFGLQVEVEPAARAEGWPLWTRTSSLAGEEQVFQGAACLLWWEMTLGDGRVGAVRVKLRIRGKGESG